MSAAKMVADSTQADVPELTSTKKRKKVVQKKKVKKRKESTKKGKKKVHQEDEFNDSDLDLEKEIHPLGLYVKNRENLLEQLFHCVRGPSLDRALPDVMKDLPIDDLKRRCMEQLEVMSKKRIQRILAGDDPASISSSGTEDETSEEEVIEAEEGEVDCGEVDQGEEIDQNELDYESMDSPVVDSTSYTHEHPDSIRDVEYGEDSNHSNQSAYMSDDNQDDPLQYEENASDEEVEMEDDGAQLDTVQSQEIIPRTPETPEEGEVFDDNDEVVEEINTGEMPNTGEEVAQSIDSNKDIEGKDNQSIDEGNDVKGVEVEKDKMPASEKEKDGDEVKSSENETCNKDDNNKVENLNNVENTTEQTEVTKDIESDLQVTKGNQAESDAVSKQVEDGEKIDNTNDKCDSRIIVKSENPEASSEKKCLQNVAEKSECDADGITVESDHVIDEEAANIGADTEAATQSSGDVPEKLAAPKKSEKPSTDTKKGKQPRRIVKPPSQGIAPELTRNQMELLELEMRARAIKAMLKTAK